MVQTARLGIVTCSPNTLVELGEIRFASRPGRDAAARGRVAGTEVWCVVHTNASACLARVRAVNLGSIRACRRQTEVENTARLGVSGSVAPATAELGEIWFATRPGFATSFCEFIAESRCSCYECVRRCIEELKRVV